MALRRQQRQVLFVVTLFAAIGFLWYSLLTGASKRVDVPQQQMHLDERNAQVAPTHAVTDQTPPQHDDTHHDEANPGKKYDIASERGWDDNTPPGLEEEPMVLAEGPQEHGPGWEGHLHGKIGLK